MEHPFRRTKKLIDVSESEDESQEAAQELQLYKDDSKEVEDTDRYEQQNVPDSEHDENGTHPEEVALLRNETTASFRADLQRRSQKRVVLAPAVGRMIFSQTFKQIKNGKMNYCLGCSSIFLVVIVVAVLITVLNNAPLFFLRLAELNAGEKDVQFTIDENTPVWSSINYTLVASLLDSQGSDLFKFHAPRFTTFAAAFRTDRCYSTKNMTNPNPAWSMSDYVCINGRRGWLWGIDTEREKAAGIGRDWDLPAPEKGEVYVSDELATPLQLKKGDDIMITVSGISILGRMWFNMTGEWTFFDTVFLRMKIKDVTSGVVGKGGSDYKRAVFMNFSSVLTSVADSLDYLTEETRQRINNLNPYEYAPQVLVNLPPQSRFEVYVDSNFDSVQLKVTELVDQLAYVLGFPILRIQLPVLSALQPFQYLSLFLGIIINVIIFTLLFICIVLIYSLLVTNAETRTFEIGIMRMFGLMRLQVIGLLLTHAVSFTFLSYPLGLIAAQGLVVVLFKALGKLIKVEISVWLSWSAILLSAALGIFVPVISSVLPIRSALGKNLQDSLDSRRSGTSAVKIKLDRSESGRFSVSIFIVGVALTLFGVSIYYLMPLSLLSFNLGLLLNLFTFLLVGMLLGMTMLSVNFQYILEKLLVTLLFFWDRASVRKVILKNLIAHRERNLKTTLLFAVSLGFIVFISVSYDIQKNSFLYQNEQQAGCLMKMAAPAAGTGSSLDSSTIVNVASLEKYADGEPLITGYSWQSQALHTLPSFSDRVTASNLGHVFSTKISIYAVSPNFFDVALDNFLKVDEFGDNTGLLESLYTPRGSHSIIMGSLYKDTLGLKINEPFLITLPIDGQQVEDEDDTIPDYTGGDNTEGNQGGDDTGGDDVNTSATNGTQPKSAYKLMTPIAFLDAAPAFTFSEFPQKRYQDALVSMTTFLRLSNGDVSTVSDIPLKSFILEFKEGISDSELDRVKKQMDSLSQWEMVATVWDYRDKMSDLDTASGILDYFFNFTTAIAMLVCAFSLNSSMFNSIYAQTREISIMRAVGVSKWWIYRIYIYEGIIIVLSSSFLGIIIGSAVGYTMVIQRALFTELPLPFVFPTNIVVVVAVSSIVLGFISSFSPIRYLMKLTIVELMRYR